MSTPQKMLKIVGGFIRQKREAKNLSQRSLGLLFTPAVTTQFISNIERGVTPLPPTHVPILAAALDIKEEELMSLLEREFTAKLSGRLGKSGSGESANGTPAASDSTQFLAIAGPHFSFIQDLYEAYRAADPASRSAFENVTQRMLPGKYKSSSSQD
jgi:transcriptional regulator with XRE-family HTH domain